MYYLLASAYDKLGKYGNACKYFEMAVANDRENPDYYRDYAIALVGSGDIKKAKKILKDAKDIGITTDNMEYVEGEIAFADKDYKKAEEIFSSCMKKSEDSYIKMRSCVMLCTILDADEKNEKNCEKKMQMLDDMIKELPVENQLPIFENQIDCYMEMYSYTEEESYRDDAVKVLETIREQGLGNYTTADNLVILYQQKKELDKAKKLLEEMEENYGNYYNTYKRFAFLEIAIQEEKDVEKRDYSDFESYYEEACKLYTKEESNNETDPEMKRLEDLYKQVKMRGWLDD